MAPKFLIIKKIKKKKIKDSHDLLLPRLQPYTSPEEERNGIKLRELESRKNQESSSSRALNVWSRECRNTFS